MDNGDIVGLSIVLFLVGIGLALVALSIWVWWRIVSRTGLSGWLSLLMLVPLANLVLLLILAFGEWPIHKELADLRRRLTPGAGVSV